MTPRELELAYKGRRKVIDEQWEMVRYTAYYPTMIHVDQKKGKFEPKHIRLPKDLKTFDPRTVKKVKVVRIDG